MILLRKGRVALKDKIRTRKCQICIVGQRGGQDRRCSQACSVFLSDNRVHVIEEELFRLNHCPEPSAVFLPKEQRQSVPFSFKEAKMCSNYVEFHEWRRDEAPIHMQEYGDVRDPLGGISCGPTDAVVYIIDYPLLKSVAPDEIGLCRRPAGMI